MSLDPNKKYIFAGTKGTTEELSVFDDEIIPEQKFIINETTHEIRIGDGETQYKDLKPICGGGIPVGGIIIWTEPIDEIPLGWHLCDGTDGTPDLRDRFIRSIDVNEEPGIIGGKNSIVLKEENVPTHLHTISTSEHYHNFTSHSHALTGLTLSPSGDHTHRFTLRSGEGGGGTAYEAIANKYLRYIKNKYNWGVNIVKRSNIMSNSNNNSSNMNHNHSIVNASTKNTSITTSSNNTTLKTENIGSSTILSNIHPKYYEVCFIIRIF